MPKSIHTPEYRSLCAELRAARASASLSQRDLAARLKVPHTWVAKVENGERRIDLIEFCWFMRACGVDPGTTIDRICSAGATRGKRGAR